MRLPSHKDFPRRLTLPSIHGVSLEALTMSQTSTTQAEASTEKRPLVIKLQNGQTFSVESNEAVDADEIPIIDVTDIYCDSLEKRQAVAEKVREAAHRIGFFYVVGHV